MKKIFLPGIMSLLCLFSFSFNLPIAKASDVLDGQVRASLNTGKTTDTSLSLYLDPGETLHISVVNYSHHAMYYKVFAPATGDIVTSGYVNAGQQVQYPKGAPVGDYKIQLICTTGSTVFTDCDSQGYLLDY